MFHCVKGVRIWSFSGRHFPTFGLNTERYSVLYSVLLRIYLITVKKKFYIALEKIIYVFSPNAGKYKPEKLRI